MPAPPLGTRFPELQDKFETWGPAVITGRRTHVRRRAPIPVQRLIVHCAQPLPHSIDIEVVK